MSLQLGKSNEEGSKGIKEAYLCVRGYACEKKTRYVLIEPYCLARFSLMLSLQQPLIMARAKAN